MKRIFLLAIALLTMGLEATAQKTKVKQQRIAEKSIQQQQANVEDEVKQLEIAYGEKISQLKQQTINAVSEVKTLVEQKPYVFLRMRLHLIRGCRSHPSSKACVCEEKGRSTKGTLGRTLEATRSTKETRVDRHLA